MGAKSTRYVLECPLPDAHPCITELTVAEDEESGGVFILDPGSCGKNWSCVSTRAATTIKLPPSVLKVITLCVLSSSSSSSSSIGGGSGSGSSLLSYLRNSQILPFDVHGRPLRDAGARRTRRATITCKSIFAKASPLCRMAGAFTYPPCSLPISPNLSREIGSYFEVALKSRVPPLVTKRVQHTVHCQRSIRRVAAGRGARRTVPARTREGAAARAGAR